MFCVVSRYVKSSLAVVVVELKSLVVFRVVTLLFLGICCLPLALLSSLLY